MKNILAPALRTISAIFALSILAVGTPAFADEAQDQAYAKIAYATVIDSAKISYGTNQYRPPDQKRRMRYGPFYIINDRTAGVDNVIDSSSPARFQAMLRDWPMLQTLQIIECPGTVDDEANFAVARMVRKAGMSTLVPSNGSARSGGVELFIAGVTRRAEPGAELGVHSWIDEYGREASEYPTNDPVHAEYVHFYEDMGFAPDKAREFYAFTNAAAHPDSIHYMTRQEIAHFEMSN